MTAKRFLSLIITTILVVAALIGWADLCFVSVLNRRGVEPAENRANYSEYLFSSISRYIVEADEEVVIDPLSYHYDEDKDIEVRLVEWYHGIANYNVTFVSLHYGTLEEMGKEEFVSYCRSLKGSDYDVFVLTACEPQTRDFCYYESDDMIIISLYSNTLYEGSLWADNYTHEGMITFKTESE